MNPPARWAGWLPARDHRDPDMHLLLVRYSNGACGVAVAPGEPSRAPTEHSRCAVCAGLAEPATAQPPLPRRAAARQ
ncbi:hypothetical protein DFQ14_102575 [Halopolyspora algeriensis]|uniref:Uncharacterized protein n=1 Tax=Halopolyspora algeriensis TaxID=1500506 RepID=A0A368VZK1_9ACTN|nr:hypothetical protein [Halopolyspora algeriensis]RCW46272.1 hypothetical protein DFQ14_102575 [Halopolyspora algeriensis]TQM55674.1 hypothetical protein FHU43_0449 [Halopolyspora algeriensis]